jgi:L-cysteine/cystine lyase
MHNQKPAELVNYLADDGLHLRSLDDPACLRACTHITSTEAEIDLLLEHLANISKGG